MSQVTSNKESINGHEYEMFMLPPMDSHELLMDVAKMVGPAVGPLLDQLLQGKSAGNLEFDKVMEQDLGPEFFTKAAGSLFSNLNKVVLKKVIDAFKEVTLVTGSGKLTDIFDVQFSGELDAMYKWIAFGMKVQWGKSLNALVGGLGDLQGKLGQKQSQSQDT